MLIDLLQELYDAIYIQDTIKMEKAYKALESVGMDRETAVQVLKAGEKYFGKGYQEEPSDSVSENDDEDLQENVSGV